LSKKETVFFGGNKLEIAALFPLLSREMDVKVELNNIVATKAPRHPA
jgi:hypothetical protein